MVALTLLLLSPIIFLIGLRTPKRAYLLWLLLTPLAGVRFILFGFDTRVLSFDRLFVIGSMLFLLANGQLGNLLPARFSKLEKSAIAVIVVFMLEAWFQFLPRRAFSVCTSGVEAFVMPLYIYFFTKYLLIHTGKYDYAMERRIVLALLCVGLYCGVMSIFEGVTGIDILPGSKGRGLREAGGTRRTNGPFDTPGILGQHISIALLLSIYYWKAIAPMKSREKGFPQWTKKPMGLILICGVIYNMFRNVWLGLVAGFSARSMLAQRERRKLILLGMTAAIVIIAAWGPISSSSIYQTRISKVETLYDRLGAWLYSFRAFSEHPIMGVGFNRIRTYIFAAQAAGDDIRVMDIRATFHPHNSYIALLAEHGLLLIIPYTLFCLNILMNTIKCYLKAKSPEDVQFGLFAVSATVAIFLPHMTDRAVNWGKLNTFVLIIFAIIAARLLEMQRLLRAKPPSRREYSNISVRKKLLRGVSNEPAESTS